MFSFLLSKLFQTFQSRMSTAELPCYTLINVPSDFETPNEMQLKSDLEKGDLKVKTEALKKTIYMILNGEKIQGLLMTIIRFVLPSQDHMIKKLLLIFWEIIPKTYPDGKLMQEMILVCDAYRKDLQHPNEFIRGSTLRFLCKLKEPELLEPLMPTIRACLEHRHSYVRGNAILAIFTIYKNFDFLIPDAPELIANFLDGEQDMSCKRNAFMMLIHADQERALSYLSTCIEQVHTFGDILQLVIVELIYRVCHQNPSERARFLRCIYNLLNSNSPAVRYEAAGTLVTLSNAPTAVKAAASAYIELIVKESDNNVKLIVLDRLVAMRDSPAYEKILAEQVMDILRVLSSPDLEVRRKTLSLAMELVTSRNIEEMVLILKKEINKTGGSNEEDTGKYRQLLVRTLHSACIKFPDVASTVIPLLMEFLSDNNELAAMDVLVFVREAMSRFPNLRPVMIEKLLEAFSAIKGVKIHRAALWILGEYCERGQDMQSLLSEIRQNLGEIPIVDDEMRKAAGEEELVDESVAAASGGSQVTKLVTADGTYATQSAFSQGGGEAGKKAKEKERPPLRKYLMEGDFFVGAALAGTLTKLALRWDGLVAEEAKQNRFTAECMLIIASILRLGTSGLPDKAITKDDEDRLQLCLKVLSDKTSLLCTVFNTDCRDALSQMLEAHVSLDLGTAGEKKTVSIQPDCPISFSQLSKLDSLVGTGDVLDISLKQALGTGRISKADFATSKLNKVGSS